ncbi:uncharacterized protein LOC115448686 isoform X1 [Manduca sexta]|uniref:uncharacterized protein LOC115448686 isoform X1 n=2 Tax=Manduca sexta TaxID=7130 RepID=UPI0018902CFA|nr:uncharacterized protein LOC115448686 isoform X1 [Manduca sexta]
MYCVNSLLLFLILSPTLMEAWRSSIEDKENTRVIRKGVHYHSKRHMLPPQQEPKRRMSTQKPREIRKKVQNKKASLPQPSGHLAPLEDDEMDNDEVVSVAIGPPPIRPKYEKTNWKHQPRLVKNVSNVTIINFVKDLLTQLGHDMLSRQVNEDFVFGQYVGNAMKNLTSDLRLNMQHEVLNLIVKYQKLNRGDPVAKADDKTTTPAPKDVKIEKKAAPNDTDEGWPDFTNLAKIVG